MFRSTAFGQISLVRNNAVADYSLQTSQVNTEIGAFLFQNLDTSDYTLQEVTFSVTDFGFPSDFSSNQTAGENQ